jgi:hypothetical protein
MLVIGIPALLIAFAVMRNLWRDAGAEARREDHADLPTPTPTTA